MSSRLGVRTHTHLDNMVRVLVTQNLATSNSNIVTLTSGQSSSLTGERRKIVDGSENVQSRAIYFTEESDLTKDKDISRCLSRPRRRI